MHWLSALHDCREIVIWVNVEKCMYSSWNASGFVHHVPELAVFLSVYNNKAIWLCLCVAIYKYNIIYYTHTL